MSVVYLLRTQVSPDGDEDFNRWQGEEHIPALLRVPGYLGVQRFVASQWPGAYLNVWRIESVAAFHSPEHDIASYTPWYYALRRHCEVQRNFAVENGPDEEHGARAAWRAEATGLTVCWSGGGPDTVDRGSLRGLGNVAHVIGLDSLDDGRSPLSPVALVYHGHSTGTGACTSEPPPAPAGTELLGYRPLTAYLPAAAVRKDLCHGRRARACRCRRT